LSFDAVDYAENDVCDPATHSKEPEQRKQEEEHWRGVRVTRSVVKNGREHGKKEEHEAAQE
jgi:hypothetical protein